MVIYCNLGGGQLETPGLVLEIYTPATPSFQIPDEFANLVLRDTGPDDNERIIMLGDQNLARTLDQSDLWLVDGTFKVVPELFFQLYTVHVKVSLIFLQFTCFMHLTMHVFE